LLADTKEYLDAVEFVEKGKKICAVIGGAVAS